MEEMAIIMSSFYEVGITLITKPDKNSTKKLHTDITHKYRNKTTLKILISRIQWILRLYMMIQWDLLQRFKGVSIFESKSV